MDVKRAVSLSLFWEHRLLPLAPCSPLARMPVFELHVDTTTQANTSTTATTAATTTTTTAAAAPDVTVSSSAYPPGTLRGDVLAIRPAHVGKGKAKDRPLLYKVDSVPQDGQSGEDGSSGAAKRRNKAHVIVSATVAQNFSWIKTRQDVFITLVSESAHERACVQDPFVVCS